MSVAWNPTRINKSAFFAPILPIYQKLGVVNHWPTISRYQHLLQQCPQPICNAHNQPIQFIEQDASNNASLSYEAQIYQHGTIPTRLESWHDFFQVLVWCTFPKTKSTLNALHYSAEQDRLGTNPNNKQRSKIENFLTLFDECGAIIVYSDPSLFELIKEFQWFELFVDNRSKFSQSIDCITFGHGMYEKGINPYIGMTAQCLFLKQPTEFFNKPMAAKTTIIDESTADLLKSTSNWTTKSLHPFPILGVPNWHQDNAQEQFYRNKNYFRDKPTKA